MGDPVGAKKVWSIAEDLPPLSTDAARARQILLNLVANAIKFTDRGNVRISAARGAEGGVRLEVEDTGVGIAPEALPRLFQRFEQLDASATRRHGGTGLGLYISRRLAEALGGRIEVSSDPGVGSRFALILPVESEVTAHGQRTFEAEADPRR